MNSLNTIEVEIPILILLLASKDVVMLNIIILSIQYYIPLQRRPKIYKQLPRINKIRIGPLAYICTSINLLARSPTAMLCYRCSPDERSTYVRSAADMYATNYPHIHPQSRAIYVPDSLVRRTGHLSSPQNHPFLRSNYYPFLFL